VRGEESCRQPDYKLYEEDLTGTALSHPVWHDTIPVPMGQDVFLIMSFDAKEQIGRFVVHCHILKHEDNGLMAPIEVWDPFCRQGQSLVWWKFNKGEVHCVNTGFIR